VPTPLLSPLPRARRRRRFARRCCGCSQRAATITGEEDRKNLFQKKIDLDFRKY
jgi:hypothetical protein